LFSQSFSSFYVRKAVVFPTPVFLSEPFLLAERIVRRLRIAIFKHTLKQEVAFHEVNSAAELVTLVHSDVQLIQEAIGDKLPQFILYLSTFVSGFAIALLKCWRLGLVLGCTVLPAILISGYVIQMLSAKFARKASAVYTTASSMSEEIVTSIRTVHAFGAQGKLLELYYKRLMKSLHYSTRKSFFRAAVIGTAIGIIFSSYALAFFYGTILLVNQQVTAGKCRECASVF
jgi:ATP-binding cassette subfamily B (MDR/TAP) protein 1